MLLLVMLCLAHKIPDTLERAQGRTRNLLVAATGSGKTVVAAFDYRELCRRRGGHPRLLFVAHRRQILRQALRTFREVLRDPGFGDLYAGGNLPAQTNHLFATIDSLAVRDLVRQLGPQHWQYVVIDECHRLAAQRFDAFARQVRPDILLGLTATPERSDGRLLDSYFDARLDGSPAVELRLWHALELQLVAPFEYYACDDDTDFSDVPWNRPGERQALERLLDANAQRARLVVREWQRLFTDAARSRALAFCVSIAHARYMCDWFNRAGLPAECVVSTLSPFEQGRALRRLQKGELCVLVTVDLFNEGVDLPMVDTLLFLRPTQSPVLFQQQLGRGLRLFPGKESCLVLDFVGQHRADFRFDRLLSSITGLSRRELIDAVEHGFAQLPPGCHVHLQKQSRERVLQGLRAVAGQSWPRMTAELQSYAALQGHRVVELAAFLRDQSLDLEDVYRSGNAGVRSGWTALKRSAGLIASEPGPEEAYFSRRAASLLHWDDPLRQSLLGSLPRLAASGAALDGATQRLLQMLAYQIDAGHGQSGPAEAFLARLAGEEPIVQELAELAGMLSQRQATAALPLPGLEDTPLILHASYSLREILTAVEWITAERRSPLRAGVLRLSKRKTELLFVTLDKREGFLQHLAYRDFAISPSLFHWQSQRSAGADTHAGQRYLQSPGNGWRFQLFVRLGKDHPYRACGPAVLKAAEGDRPMSITWELQTPLPARLFAEFSVLGNA